MNKDNIVVLKGDKALEFQTDTMYPNTFYRCLEVAENNNKQYCIYGIIFDQVGFDKYFEFGYDKIIRDWLSIGLIESNGKLISKSKFKSLANVHTYGKVLNNNRIILFGIPNKCLYGFYPMYSENKSKQLDATYEWAKQTFIGNMRYIDQDSIQFGNCGIPIVSGNLRVTK